jgi:hypothetical protein
VKHPNECKNAKTASTFCINLTVFLIIRGEVYSTHSKGRTTKFKKKGGRGEEVNLLVHLACYAVRCPWTPFAQQKHLSFSVGWPVLSFQYPFALPYILHLSPYANYHKLMKPHNSLFLLESLPPTPSSPRPHPTVLFRPFLYQDPLRSISAE